MKRYVALLLLSGCAAPDIADLPPVSVGGGGASLMSPGSDPVEAYDNAYSRLTGYHLKIRQHLQSRSPNVYGAVRALEQIVESLETMRSLLAEPHRSRIQPYVQWYREVKAHVEGNRPLGALESDLGRKEQEIKSGFKLSAVELASDAPAGKTETPAKTPPDAPGEAPRREPAPAETPTWMFFAAWKQSHAELVDAYARKADCARSYRRVREALAGLKARLPEERRKSLALCEASYGQQHDETKGFTAAPPGGKIDDALAVLRLIAGTIDPAYDPDRK